MRATLFALPLALGAAIASVAVAEESPISSTDVSADNSPEAVTRAKERGAASAAKDILAGILRILYFGRPWSVGKPLVDDATGYRIQILGGCVVTGRFVAEVEAYNGAMRQWHAKNRPTATPR